MATWISDPLPFREGACTKLVSGVEPRSQRMNCRRCQGLMVPITLEDLGSSSVSFSGWRCLLCGAVIDSGIDANRTGPHRPTRSRDGPRYGVSLVQ